jgi:hypothetical protein
VNNEHEIDPQINEAITRLQQKMQDVNHGFAETKSQKVSRPSRGYSSKAETGKRAKKRPIIGRIMGLSVVAVISLGIASFIGPQLEGMAQMLLSSTGAVPDAIPGGQTPVSETDTVAIQFAMTPETPVASGASTVTSSVASGTVSAEPAEQTTIIKPAAFQLTSASYEIQDTDSGPTLEIAVSVANIGGQDGRPHILEITLVDGKDSSLMSWPMVLSGSPIPAGNQTIYRTSMVEPPKDFANVQISMRTP